MGFALAIQTLHQRHLGIAAANGEVGQGYFGGEARAAHHYGYGEYSVSMKPAKVDGKEVYTVTGVSLGG